MASMVTVNTVAGDKLIIAELAKQLKYTKKEFKFLLNLAESGVVAVETMLELAISKIGKLERSIIDGQDFTDKSDAKKGTVSIISTSTGYKSGSRGVTIGNIRNKKGLLRVMVAEPFTDELFYFKIPNKELNNRHNIKIRFDGFGGEPMNLNEGSLSHRIWNNYRIATFEEFCK
jgi:hypothetical protein